MTTPDVHIVGIAGPVHDYPAIIADHCRSVGLSCSVHTIPFVPIGEFGPQLALRLTRLIRAAPPQVFTVYTPGWAEFFNGSPDLSLHFSHFRSWFDPERARVMPYAWGYARPTQADDLLWNDKPAATVGFRGATYEWSRVARTMATAPSLLKQWLLRGHYLRSPALFGSAVKSLRAIRFIAAFPRFEALQVLASTSEQFGLSIDLAKVDTFSWSEEKVEAFKQHLLRSTYVLCPRGAENYSLRVYEALRFGRVPVIIDTDMVLPDEVPWDRVALRVPYAQLHDLAKIIADDYASHSGAQFRARQQLALETSAMLDSGSWLTGVAQDILRRVESKRRRCAETSYHPSKALDSVSVL